MANYWLLSAGKDGDLWSAFWTEDKIAIGWSAVGDLRQYDSREQLWSAFKKLPGNRSLGNKAVGQAVGRLWTFYEGIAKGDLVFIRSYAFLIGTAIVEGDYDFLSEDNPLRHKFCSADLDDCLPHVREVRWLSLAGGMKQPGFLNSLTIMPAKRRQSKNNLDR